MAAQERGDVEALVQQRVVVEDRAVRVVEADAPRVAQVRRQARQAAAEEEVRSDGPQEEHVVVEEDEPLGEVPDAVQVHLDRPRVEGGEPLGGDEVAVVDEAQLRRGFVEPVEYPWA